MGSDISRSTFDPSKHYSGVRQQQGRPNLDADWNEQVDIASQRVVTETQDVIGSCGAPARDAGFQLVQPNSAWAAGSFFGQGSEIVDSNGSVEVAIAGGTSGAAPPTWPTSVGTSVTDGTSGLVWQLVGSDVVLSAGRMYVDGNLCEASQQITYATQTDYPSPPPFPTSGTVIVYLDVWERTITALQDPDLLEVALGGPDTTTRTKTVWQVKLVDVSSVETNVTCSTSASALAPWEHVIQRSAAQLTTGLGQSGSSGPCALNPNTGYTGMENQLYRVEIHQSGVYGWQPGVPYLPGAEVIDSNGSLEIAISAGTSAAAAPSWPTTVGGTVTDGTVTWQLLETSYKPVWEANQAYAVGNQIIDSNGNLETVVAAGTSGATAPTWPTGIGTPVSDGTNGLLWRYAAPTFKWSRDNASVATAVTGVASVTNTAGNPASQLTVQSLGRDKVLGFAPGNWIEITDDWRALNNQPGELHRIDSVGVANKTITLDSYVSASNFPVNANGQTDPNRHTIITRWDQSGQVYLSDATTVWVDLGAPGSTGDIPIPPVGTTVMLENGITVSFNAYPANGPVFSGDYWTFAARTADASVEVLTQEPPRGIQHHYCRLGVINLGTTPWTIQDCRLLFPPLASPAIHVTNTNWVNDDVFADLFTTGLQVTFDSSIDPNSFPFPFPAPAPVAYPSFVVTLEGATNATTPASLTSFVLGGSVTCAANVVTWKPGIQASFLDQFETPLVRVRVTLKGNSIWSLNGSGLYLDGDTFGSPSVRSDNLTPRIAMPLPSGDSGQAADFEGWFWLLSTGLAISNFTLSPPTVVQGGSSTGTITLNGTAPTGGIPVTLSNPDTNVASVPATVVVPAGSATVTFTVTGIALGSANIQAALDTSTVTASLTVVSVALASLTLNPSSVQGGTTSTGTVTLNGPAPAAVTIGLSSSVTSRANVPIGVTIPAGASSAQFTITTIQFNNLGIVSLPVSVAITASYEGATVSATLQVSGTTQIITRGTGVTGVTGVTDTNLTKEVTEEEAPKIGLQAPKIDETEEP
jgi:hypothetical protein